MMSRRELENLIFLKLQEMRRAEALLNASYSSLSCQSKEGRAGFVSSLADLQQRAEQVEQMITALDQSHAGMTPAAA
jgi:hypothetical protein